MSISHAPTRIGRLFLLVVLLITQLTACGDSDSSLPLQFSTRPFALSYSNDSAVYVVGRPIRANRPRVAGQVNSYAVEPALPPGLALDPLTGVIRGTPGAVSAAAIYTVTATNSSGSAVGRIQIEVFGHAVAPSSLRYPLESAIYVAGQQIPPNEPVATGGEITQFSVAPPLPSGLSLDPLTGTITGVPGTPQAATPYAVTGANSAGEVQATISIAVQQLTGSLPPTVMPPPGVTPPPGVVLPPEVTPPPLVVPPATVSYEDAVYVVGQAIVPNVPTVTGGPPAQFTVRPALPDGLAIDPATGVISGAPTTPQAESAYTVAASNSAGQAQTTLSLTVTALGAWTPSGSLDVARRWHTAALRPGGSVLVAGGFTTRDALNAVETRNQLGTWSASPPMTARRFLHTSNALQDGRVLVMGGVAASGSSQNSAEVFDTLWNAAPPMATARESHTATLLGDGRVLVVGGNVSSGNPTALAEIYTPATGTWAAAAPLHGARSDHTATLLADGRVLVAGGEDSSNVLASAELYDPAADTWTEMPQMSRPRRAHSAALLPDGSVLVAGGASASAVPTNEAEMFDLRSLGWQSAPPMRGRRQAHTATAMANGQVVVVGGTGLGSRALSSVETFDPASRLWLATASLATARGAHTATLMPDGRLLVVAGYGAGLLGSTELFDMSSSGTAGR